MSTASNRPDPPNRETPSRNSFLRITAWPWSSSAQEGVGRPASSNTRAEGRPATHESVPGELFRDPSPPPVHENPRSSPGLRTPVSESTAPEEPERTLGGFVIPPRRKAIIRVDYDATTCFDPADKELYDLWAPKT